MELTGIINLMQSEDYKERFKGEYHYIKRNFDRLPAMLGKRDARTLDFTPDCPHELLDRQIRAMAEYIGILEERAVIEGVTL